MTACNICPDGTWTYIEGALRADDCAPCGRTNHCEAGATARLTVALEGLDLAELTGAQRDELKSTFAGTIAVECDFPGNESVWDLFGHNGTVSLAATSIEAFLAVPENSSANVLVRVLYSEGFKELLAQSTALALGMPKLTLGAVVLKLESFQPLVETTTATTTVTTSTRTASTTSTKSTTTTTSTSMTVVHKDLRGTEEPWTTNAAGTGSGGPAFLVCLLVGIAALAATPAVE